MSTEPGSERGGDARADERADERPDERTAFARRLFPDGEEPDPRFTLANERTFLAWTRTALAFLAGGIALAAFEIQGMHPRHQSAVAVLVILGGVAIAGGAAVRWVHVERAMRTGKPLPVPAIIPVLSLLVFVALAITIVLIVV
ncbi:YidH family protein [Corynebacterium glaucum]|uniref:YidH family protein n=1 Tax=Corynebacterium glaucum TaxID=187491 RepID=UPI00265A53D4|nr:DUF202 domain-containing protein [Corynebacterium glaucum]